MKRVRIAALLAVLGGVLFYYVPGFRDFARGLGDGWSAAPGGGKGSGTMYKWKDADGSWHYGNVRPAGHPEAEEVRGGDVTWVKGSEEAPAAEGGGGEEARSAGERLRQSRELEGQAVNRESELEKLAREAGQD